VDHLGFEQPVDGFGEGVIITVADAAYRRLDPGLRETPSSTGWPRTSRDRGMQGVEVIRLDLIKSGI
jgi:hypothetical protein